MKYKKGNYKLWLVEKGNTFNTFKAEITATEGFTAEEAKKDMFKSFNVQGNIDNFKLTIELVKSLDGDLKQYISDVREMRKEDEEVKAPQR